MKRSDLKDAYNPVPEAFHDALTAALRDVREEETVKKRHISLLAAIVIIALLCGTAVAVMDYYSVRDYEAEGMPSEAFEKHITEINKTYENEYVKMVVGDAIFDGSKMAFTLNLYPKDEQKRVYLYPSIEGFCGDRKLDIQIEGMRGMDESGFLFPGLEWDEQYLENSYALDVTLSEDVADTDVTWVFKMQVLAPNWEIVDNAVKLTGEATDMPVDQYMQLYRDAYNAKKIMTSYGSSLAEYASIIPASSPEMPLYECLIECGAFSQVTTFEQTFVTPLPPIKVVENLSFTFDDYSVTLDRLSVSFMRVDLTLRHFYPTERDDSAEGFERVNYELRDQDGNVISGIDSATWLSDDKRELNRQASYTTGGQEITSLTFVPFRFEYEAPDTDSPDAVCVYDEAHSFTVELK